MKRPSLRLCVSVVNIFFLFPLCALAQFGRGAGEWSTTAADAQRSSWVRTDGKISTSAIQKGGFGLTWKLKLADAAGQGNTFISETVLLNGYIGYRGFRSLGYTVGANGRIYAMDTDLGRIEWQKPLGAGMTANVSRTVATAFPGAPQPGRGGPGRGTAAKSGVGVADEGAVTIKEIAEREAAMARGGGNAGRGGFPGGPPRRMPNYLYAISADGMLHSMYVSNADEPEKAVPFLPARSKADGLIVLTDVAYAVTPNAAWAIDLESHKITSWKASGDVAGPAGPAIAPDGTLYVTTTSGDLAALEAKSLSAKSTYAAHAEFTSSPVIFQFNDKTLVAAATKDNHIHLLDTAALDKPFAPQSIGFAPDALASWQDPAGTRWILASSASAVTAWKLVEKDGAPALTNGWTSRDLASPTAPLILNGVVFTFARGSGALYAIDGTTGKDIWNSGSTVSAGGPATVSAGGMQVYLATRDGVLYAFGFPIEH
jgi:outer membrane protein assembly factor BamB